MGGLVADAVTITVVGVEAGPPRSCFCFPHCPCSTLPHSAAAASPQVDDALSLDIPALMRQMENPYL